jgi:hypothetical protein
MDPWTHGPSAFTRFLRGFCILLHLSARGISMLQCPFCYLVLSTISIRYTKRCTLYVTETFRPKHHKIYRIRLETVYYICQLLIRSDQKPCTTYVNYWSDPIWHDPNINELDMSLNFLIRIGSVRFRSTRSDPVNYIF